MKDNKTAKTNNLHARIKNLEEQKEKLISSRKEEIANTIIQAGGLGLDNRLLAGFTSFAVNSSNQNSEILKEMMEVAKGIKIPSKRKSRRAQ